jgi:hypothetical protein
MLPVLVYNRTPPTPSKNGTAASVPQTSTNKELATMRNVETDFLANQQTVQQAANRGEFIRIAFIAALIAGGFFLLARKGG